MSLTPRAEGDTWRWDPSEHYEWGFYSIDVIERPGDAEQPQGKRTIPFGFGPRDPESAPEWEGNPS